MDPWKPTPAPCKICSRIGYKLCDNCRQAHYCSSKHQIQHWQTHQKDCFPVIVKDDPNLRQHFIASRDINQGDVILKEEALIVGPLGVPCANVSICLGCCCVIRDSAKSSGPTMCSICKWPVCGVECEKKSGHADNECKIFGKNNVPPVIFGSSEEYYRILLLRCLLLRESSPERWINLMRLQPKTNPKCNDLLDTMVYFIQKTCGLTHFDRDVIGCVDGLIQNNAFGDKPEKSIILALLGQGLKIRLLMPILGKSRKISHSCVPNCKFVVEEFQSDDSCTSTYIQTVIAIVMIPAGQPFKLNYTNVMTGTNSRRLVLLAEEMFNCTCDRCKDPTELGTYFSAVKCQECTDGYYLPENSLNYRDDAIWKCNAPGHAYAQVKTQMEIRAIENLVCAEIKNTRPCATERLDEVLKKHSGVTLHKNHFILQDLKQDIIFEMAAILRRGNYGGQKPFINYLFKRTLELTNDCLRVADCLFPGWNEYRGIFLHVLAQIKYQLIAKNIGQLTPEKIRPYVDDLLITFEDGKHSLAAGREGSVASRLRTELCLFQSLVSGETTFQQLGMFKFPQMPVKIDGLGLDCPSSYPFSWSASESAGCSSNTIADVKVPTNSAD